MIKGDIYLLDEHHSVTGTVTGFKEQPNRWIVRTTRGETLVFNTKSENWEGSVTYPTLNASNFIANISGAGADEDECEDCCDDCEECGCCGSVCECACDEESVELYHGGVFTSKAGPVLVVSNPDPKTFSDRPWIGFYWTATSETICDIEDTKSYMVKQLDSEGRYYDADDEDVYDGLFDIKSESEMISEISLVVADALMDVEVLASEED